MKVHSFKTVPVFVTGAGRGIGKRLAIGFAAKGARVGLLARSKAELDLCHLEIEHAGGNALRLRADVGDYEQVAAAVERMRVHFGAHPKVLICAAAMLGPIGPFAESNPKSWEEVVHTNFSGVLNACRAVLPHMLEKRSGKIIILAGGGASPSRPNFAVYSATKTALVRFVETLAEEVSEHNVQVNCLSPGGTYTHMTDQILAAGDRAGWRETEAAEQIRLTGGMVPEKQIELALFLASELSNHVSGRLLHVHDDWKKLRDSNVSAELYRLRRVQKI
jgi:NAD(P)-dependent dehydrogenase (short-subunit alcohol dehydrogenase family)